MKLKFIVIGLVILIVVGIGAGLYSANAQSKQIASNNAQTTDPSTDSANQGQIKKASEPIIDDFEGVQIAAMWEKNPAGSDTQSFMVQLNNHAEDLDDFNFAENIALEINGQLTEAKVINVQKSGAGHHVSSKVEVQGTALTQLKSGDKLTLVMKKVLDTPDRRFTWTY